jgi:NAD-dependent dihydropyrimidine dehydrogenase PreA subunit
MLKYLKNVSTLQVNARICNGCGICLLVCPQEVLEINEKKAEIIDMDGCIECGACALNCPVKAIKVQTGVGCATGLLLGSLGIKNECSPACGASPAGEPAQTCGDNQTVDSAKPC